MLQSGEGEVDVTGDAQKYDTVPIDSSTDIDSADMPTLDKHHLLPDTREQALQRLRDAAGHVVSDNQGSRRVPRASRLSPVHDISGDIQRDSTPMPSLSASADGRPPGLSNVWSWSQETAIEHDDWASADPLLG